MTLGDIIRNIVKHPSSKTGQYELGDVLGAGAFGVVRKGVNKATGEEVAIKVISRKEVKKVRDGEDSVMAELNILWPLDHPHIVKIKDWFETKDKYYMVTQLCTGGELFDRIIEEGRFTEEDASRSIRDVAEALQYLHARNIVHRDVKPENLLFVDTRRNSPLVLADFGIAKSLVGSHDKIKSAAGSLGYAAPEIFSPDGHGKPCDIWSLGVVMYTILSGYSPFRAESVNEFLDEVQPGFRVHFHAKYWSDVSDDAKVLISRMIQYDPDERPTINEVLNDKWFKSDFVEVKDLLPSIKPGLSTRMRWRLGFEKILLYKRLKELSLDSDDDSNGTKGDSGDSTSSHSSHHSSKSKPKLSFHDVVIAAQRNKALQDEAERSTHSTHSAHSTHSEHSK